MSNGWTPARRAKQAEAIRRWKPWSQSSGPVTTSGKAASSRNAYKGGGWRKERELLRILNQTLGREHFQESLQEREIA